MNTPPKQPRSPLILQHGTAILGLVAIRRGALASKPVMEARACVVQTRSPIALDVFDIEVDTHDPHTIIES